MKTSRRAFLLGAGAVVAASAFPLVARAQSTTSLVLGLSQSGYPIIAASANGVTLTNGQRAVLSRVGSQIARRAATRASANVTFSAVARAMVMNAPRAGLWGIAAAAAVGGAYYLWTGQSPLDPIMNMTFGSEGMMVAYPCSCAEVPVQSGSYPDTVTMGFYKQSSCSNTAYYRIAVITNNSATSSGRPDANWSWAHTQSLGGGQYRHFYTRSIYMDPATCGDTRLGLPGNTDWGKTLTEAQKLKALSGAALDALGLSSWSWTAKAGFEGGGSYGGAGTGGSWEGPPQELIDKVTQTPLGVVDDIDEPLPYKGTLPDPAPITVGEALEPWPVQSDPGFFEFPPEVKFPDDDGYTPPGGGGTDPEEPENPVGEGDDWTSWLPSMPDFGLPDVPAVSIPDLPSITAPVIAAPSIAATCVDPVWGPVDIPYILDGWTKSMPVCEFVAPAADYFKPILVGAGYIVGGWRAMRRLI